MNYAGGYEDGLDIYHDASTCDVCRAIEARDAQEDVIPRTRTAESIRAGLGVLAILSVFFGMLVGLDVLIATYGPAVVRAIRSVAR